MNDTSDVPRPWVQFAAYALVLVVLVGAERALQNTALGETQIESGFPQRRARCRFKPELPRRQELGTAAGRR